MKKPETIIDWFSEPKHEFRCEVTLRPNAIQWLFGLSSSRKIVVILAETKEDAMRVAEYHFPVYQNLRMGALNDA